MRPLELLLVLVNLLAAQICHAGFARYEHEPALPLACLASVLMQRCQLALPLNQPHLLIVRRIDE
jgi:hypothetical protein